MKIYTRTGDAGETSLFSGERVSKAARRVEAYGAIDEMNSVLGAARAAGPAKEVAGALERLQSEAFKLGADLATSLTSARPLDRMTAADARRLEREMDQMTAELPELRSFILPGGTAAAAQIHVARALCRRAERLTVALGQAEAVNPEALIYLNRLSDYLFTLARWENFRSGVDETRWTAGNGF